MPSSILGDDESNGDADPRKIPTTQMWKWSDLVELQSTKSSTGFAIATPMKRSVRPIFSLVLLIALGATLTCRVMTRHVGRFGFGSEEVLRIVVQPPAPVFNSTLLKYAAIDIGEPQARKEIEQLMDGNFGSSGRYRTFANWRRFSTRDISSSSSSRGMAMTMRSPQLYRYWLEFRRLLSRWSRDLRYQPRVMDELVEMVKVPIERHNGGSSGPRRRYGSCAVVGNSGILLQKEYGGVIDGHDAVIRLNNARIQRFEKNVGAKTTISFVNSNILHLCSRRQDCFCHPYGASVPIVMYICQPVHFLDYTVCNSSHKAPLIVTDPRFDVLCTRIVKYYSLKRFAMETGKSLDAWGSAHDGSMFHYSSGMQAVMLAVGICDRVSVFGFGKSTSAKHHYHTNQKAELHLHDYQAEYDFYQDLVNHPRAIPFVPGSFQFPPVTVYQ